MLHLGSWLLQAEAFGLALLSEVMAWGNRIVTGAEMGDLFGALSHMFSDLLEGLHTGDWDLSTTTDFEDLGAFAADSLEFVRQELAHIVAG